MSPVATRPPGFFVPLDRRPDSFAGLFGRQADC
jgi:hypothetical protein